MIILSDIFKKKQVGDGLERTHLHWRLLLRRTARATKTFPPQETDSLSSRVCQLYSKKTTTTSVDYSVLNIDLNMTSYLTLNSMLSRMWQATLMGSPRRGRPRSAILSSSLKSSGASSTNFLNSTFSPSCKNRRKNTKFRQSVVLIRLHLVDFKNC